MYLHEIQSGSKVFIDANIFVYHFSKDSKFNKSCTDFLCRVETAEIHGLTSVTVVLEATHRLMMIEASAVLDVETKNLPKYLKQHPETAKQLKQHLIVPGKISELNVEIVQITSRQIKNSQDLKSKYGFLSNDALTIGIMEELGTAVLASNDSDFKRVEWLKVYIPSQC